MSIKIVNIRSKEPYDFYLGRENKTYRVKHSIFANPYVIGKDGDRAEVIEKYKTYFLDRVEKDPKFRNAALKLNNSTCACWCNFPHEDCHLRIISEWIEDYLTTNPF